MLWFEFKFFKTNFNFGTSKLTTFIYGTQVIYGWLSFFVFFFEVLSRIDFRKNTSKKLQKWGSINSCRDT